MILCKLIKNEIIVEINGCVSTGKEANVYHATSPDPGMDYAIKIFKSSILKFKDRSKYVTGEFRFRRGYSGNNPRKMVNFLQNFGYFRDTNIEKISKLWFFLK